MAPSLRRRWATGAFALVLTGAGIAFAAWAFRQAPASRPIAEAGPTETVDPRVTAQVPVGGFPGGLAAGEGSVWVPHQECDGSLVRIDQDTNQVIAEIPTEIYPSNVAVGFGGVWVEGSVCDEDKEPGRLVRIDPETNEVAATVALPGHSADIASGEGGIWVSVGFGTNAGEPWKGELLRIDPDTNTIDARVPIEGNPRDVVVGEGSVWVLTMASRDGGSSSNMFVHRIDPVAERVVGAIPDALSVGVGEGAVWVSAWIGEWETGLRKVDASTLETIDTIERDFRAFYGEHNTLGTFPVGEGGLWFWAFPDRSASSAQGHGRIYRLNSVTLEEDASVAPDPHRDWIDAALDPETHTLWISHYRDFVTRIDMR